MCVNPKGAKKPARWRTSGWSRQAGQRPGLVLTLRDIGNIIVGIALPLKAARELVRIGGALLGWIVTGVQLLL